MTTITKSEAIFRNVTNISLGAIQDNKEDCCRYLTVSWIENGKKHEFTLEFRSEFEEELKIKV